MKVKLIKTGETVTVNNGYGLRLMEQGKAVAVAETARKPEKKTEKKPADKEPKVGDA